MNVDVFLTGTDPASKKGGIGFALPGYLRALNCADIAWTSIPTYHPSTPGGKWLPWLAAFPKLRQQIAEAHKRNQRAIVYSHAGAGVSLLREFFVLAFCRALGAATIVHLHAISVDHYLQHPLKRILFKLAIAPALCVAVLTPWWLRRLESAGLGKALCVIPNPLSPEWEARARLSRSRQHDASKIILLSLTRLVPGKGVDLVIEAMPLLPAAFELIVAGEGSQRNRLEQRVTELNLANRVRFTGWVTGTEKQQLIDASDVFVLPSRYDSFGLGFVEAMANGLPVVGAKWGPIVDVVAEPRCGILIAENSPRALADAILHFADSDIRGAVGGEAQQWVLEQFSADAVGKRIRVMLEHMAKQNTP